MLRFIVVATLLSASVASAQVEPKVVGTWVAPMMGFNMVFQINKDGSCVFDEENGRCAAKGGTLTWTGPAGVERYRYALQGNTLTVSGGDMDMAVAFQKKGGGASKASSVEAPATEEKAAPAAKGQGQSFSKPAWGVRFTGPGGWKFAEKDGAVLGGHDTEAGLLIVRYEFATTREKITADYNQGLNEGGVSAMPSAPATKWRGGGVAGELTGTMNGTPIKIRSIALLNGYGGALVVAGLTTPDKYATLKARVEQLAGAVTMQKPKQAQGGGLAGAYAFMYFSKSGGYSREAYITLCRSGRFTRRGEMIGSGANGSAATASGNAGTWSAQGDGNSGTLILNYGDGSSGQVNYKTSFNPKDKSAYGNAIWLGNDLYQKTGAGDC